MPPYVSRATTRENEEAETSVAYRAGDAMSDAIVVLNAGASGLKFSIYRIGGEDPRLAARGVFDGFGTEPHFKAKDPKGRILADAGLDAEAARVGHVEAFEHLLQWTRAEFGGRLSPAAVGHRVAHGGVEFVGP